RGAGVPRCLLRCLLRPWAQVLLLYLVTFGILLPLLCHGRRHSRYFWRSAHLGRLTAEALEGSRARGEEAERYFREAGLGEGSPGLPSPAPGPGPQLVVAIITMPREQGAGYHYYLQVASQFHRLLRGCPWCQGHRLFACNVHHRPQEHWEARLASRLVPVAQRFGPGAEADGADNRFEKEKQDYLYCLHQALAAYSPQHVLLVEDDAVPSEDFFPVLRDLLGRRLLAPQARDALYVKLYHPERLQGYLNPEPMRILEWLGLGAFCGTLLSGLHRLLTGRHSPLLLAALAAFSMLVAELAGRHYLLEARRLSPQLYALVPATECCTPAMLYSAPAARRVLAYLEGVQCRSGYAKDTALYALLSQQGERAYALEPNLVTHIGLYSTLRGFIAQPSL
ncbi:transmembrane protein 246, partial [Carcharodon carcharias]|uniref:transmembrane protein 246 n=1 Tax=Carcharodon carcharias TaxID=13397 RepID=UPI001B7E2DF9